MEFIGDIPRLMEKWLHAFHIGSDFPDTRSGEIWYTVQKMEWKYWMFGSTAEYDNNSISDLFALCGRQFLTLAACVPAHEHRLSIISSVQWRMACHKFIQASSVNIPMYLL